MNVRVKFVLTMLLFGTTVLVFAFGLGSSIHKRYVAALSYLPKSPASREQGLVAGLAANPPLAKTQTLKLRVPTDSAYLGVDTSLKGNDFAEFEKMVGKKFAVANEYVYWGEKDAGFDQLLAAKFWLENKVLMVTWNPSRSVRSNSVDQPEFRLEQITAGRYDSYIKSWAKQVNTFNRPIIIRFAPEMNGNWLPWGTKYATPAQYVKTYRYVVDFFRREKADNVVWMWSPNETDNGNLLDYYPGDGYVDWVGLSGFNWGGLQAPNRWRSLGEIYQRSLDQLADVDKPVALAEVGSVESRTDPQAKAKWITEGFAALKSSYPKVKMLVWFNGISFKTYDWRVNTSPDSLSAFRQAISDNYFLGTAEVENP